MLRASLVTSWLVFLGSPAAALTVTTVGAEGAPGADGESVVATAASADAENSAEAVGGGGGESPGSGDPPGDGGSADASAQTSVVGAASATASATGGRGGAGPLAVGGAGRTGRASAEARNESGESVEVVALAIGGRGGSAISGGAGGPGGAAELGTVYGASTGGGAVSVRGEAYGGIGGGGDAGNGAPAGDGASVALVDAVDGDTSGSLTLLQIARGGLAGDQGGGTPGATSSRLDVAKSLQALGVTSLAYGSLDAESRATAENAGGGVSLHSEAYGGAAGRGGDARNYAQATSLGDGHAVVVAPTDPLGANATGGPGGGLNRGGDAISASQGLAVGDSPVSVEDRAMAGDGGFGSDLGPPGVGGVAFSLATALNQGSSPVRAFSKAQGGRGGGFSPFFGGGGEAARGGAARAESTAMSFYGEVESQATATGGAGGFSFDTALRGPGGRARARADATGASGEARADAHTRGLEILALSAETSGSVVSETRVESSVSVGDSFVGGSLTGPLDAFAIAAGHPSSGDVDDATEGTTAVAAAFADGAIEIVLGLGQVGLAKQLIDESSVVVTRRAALAFVPEVFAVSVLQDVMVGFMNPVSLGSGFDSLRFRANVDSETVADVSFDELEEAIAYFDDRVLDLGGLHSGCTEIPPFPPVCFASTFELIFDWTGTEAGDGFGVDLIAGLTPVPEPSTALLFATGLAALAARARRRRALI